MKVINVENKNSEWITMDDTICYERYLVGVAVVWMKDNKYCKEKVQELEAAYQRHVKPPFEIYKTKTFDCFYKMSLNIKGKEYPLEGTFDVSMTETYEKELSQALNSLIDKD